MKNYYVKNKNYCVNKYNYCVNKFNYCVNNFGFDIQTLGCAQLASPQGSLHFVNPYPDLCNLQGNAQETELFYYHPDHLGSTGMVTDNSSIISQGFLYAPFGEIISEYTPGWETDRIPKYAFNAKELDEENGMYYYSARYYAPPTFISRDPMFEKYPSISPYTYCANNPMKYVDPTGEDWVEREVDGVKEAFYDRKVRSQADVNKKYGENSGVTHLADGSKVGNGQYTVYNDHKNNRDGVIKDKNGNVVNNDRTILQNEGYTIFAGVTDKSINAETLHNNFFGTSYIGPNNPKDYNGDDNYDYIPRNPSEMPAFRHDQAYDAIGTAGIKGALLDLRTLKADYRLIKECWDISKNPAMSAKDRSIARKTAIGFGTIMGIKIKLTTPF
ncbi:MAG: RHS repeat-associated core domain-containing protein [Bacteroidales bacterium]|nr:RHS repeat-associated core domain-containing protein [Bacteroidales bacterium]